MSRALVVCATIVLAFATAASAQMSGQPGLAEVARQAEAAKPTAPKAKKSYTNADLSPGGLPPAPVEPSSGFMSSSLGKPVSAEEMLKLSEAKAAADVKQKQPDEYWIGQATAIRRQLEKMTPRLATLRSRDKNPNASVQQRADQEIQMIQQQMESLRKRWAGLEDEARTAKVSMALLMPPPVFPQ
jgi:hypothetical protein